jgi:hypothetical protein
MADPEFTPVDIPVSKKYLIKEGLIPTFVNYMRRWPNFVS